MFLNPYPIRHRTRLAALSLAFCAMACPTESVFASNAKATLIAPDFHETRTVSLTQTIHLKDIPVGSKQVKLWIPIPTDRNWQRVLDLSVTESPGVWKIVPQAEGRGDFLFVEVTDPPGW